MPHYVQQVKILYFANFNVNEAEFIQAPTINALGKNKKKIAIVFLKLVIFTAVKNRHIPHRPVHRMIIKYSLPQVL